MVVGLNNAYVKRGGVCIMKIKKKKEKEKK
jgi:hypothetical protein